MQGQAAAGAAAARAAAVSAMRGPANATGRDTLGLVEEEEDDAAAVGGGGDESDVAAVAGATPRPSPAAPSVLIFSQPTATTDGDGRSPPSPTPRRARSPAPLLRPAPVRPTLPAAAASGPFSPASLDTHLTSPIAPAAQPSGTPLSPDPLAEPPATNTPSAFAASGQLLATALGQQHTNAMAWRPLAAGPLGLQDRLPVTSPRPDGDPEQQQQQQHREHFHDAEQVGRHVSLPAGSPGPGAQPPHSTGLRRRPRASTSLSTTTLPGGAHDSRPSSGRPFWSPTPDTTRGFEPADTRARQHTGLQPQHQPDTNIPLSVPFSVLVFGSGMFKTPGASAELETGLPRSDARPRAASQNQPWAVSRARPTSPMEHGVSPESTGPSAGAAGAASAAVASAAALTASTPAQRESCISGHAIGGPGGDIAATTVAAGAASGTQGAALSGLQSAAEGLRGLLRSALGSATGVLSQNDSGTGEHPYQQQDPQPVLQHPGPRQAREDGGGGAGGPTWYDGPGGASAAGAGQAQAESDAAEAGVAQVVEGAAGEPGAAMDSGEEQPGGYGTVGRDSVGPAGEHPAGALPPAVLSPVASASGGGSSSGGGGVLRPARGDLPLTLPVHVPQLAMPPVPLAEDLLFATVMMGAPPTPLGQQQVPSAAAHDGGVQVGVGAEGEGAGVGGVEGAVALRHGLGPASGAGVVHGEEGAGEEGVGAVRGVFQRAVGWVSSAVGVRQVVRETVEEEVEKGEAEGGEGGLGIV